MNKNTKIRVNYLAGGIIFVLLIWNLSWQVYHQVHRLDNISFLKGSSNVYLALGILFMVINLSLEAGKWYLLINYTESTSFASAYKSYLAGMAFSMITPNRVGEYPGRILYLRKNNTYRLINVSILGAMAQLLSVFIFGAAGLLVYAILFHGVLPIAGFAGCVCSGILFMIFYFRFETLLQLYSHKKWLRRLFIYGKLIKKITMKKQVAVLAISMMRVLVFTAQYLFLMKWMNIDIPLVEGFSAAAIFFCVMAVIPSIALAELGIRGEVSLYLFRQYSPDILGILVATTGIWLLNLVLPSLIGSVLLFKMKFLR